VNITPDQLAAHLKREGPAPLYLVVGDDERAKDEVVAAFVSLVEPELQALDVERFHGDADPAAVVSAARTLPMLSERRVILYLHVERLFKTRRKAAAADDEEAGESDEEGSRGEPSALEEYVAAPQSPNVLVLVATNINRSMRLGKLLEKHAVTVDCKGFEAGFGRPDAALREAMQFVAAQLRKAGKSIDAPALSMLVERAGPNVGRLRGDIERLVLFVGDAPKVTEADVRAVSGAAKSLDDWGVTNAIQARDAAAALRLLALALDNGSVPFMVLGQLGWWVRTKMAQVDQARVPHAVRAVFRADGAMKSGGQPRVVLERLVVELCGPGRTTAGQGRPGPSSYGGASRGGPPRPAGATRRPGR
jgi:DNA polymerase III delta subunit